MGAHNQASCDILDTLGVRPVEGEGTPHLVPNTSHLAPRTLAGRVQSVALRLVCEREIEVEAFKPTEYWTVEADFKAEAAQVCGGERPEGGAKGGIGASLGQKAGELWPYRMLCPALPCPALPCPMLLCVPGDPCQAGPG